MPDGNSGALSGLSHLRPRRSGIRRRIWTFLVPGGRAAPRRTCLPRDRWLVDKLGAWLAASRIRHDNDPLQNVALARFQQLSAPLCAKAVEDTAFYRYGRLISRNDVGFDVASLRLLAGGIPSANGAPRRRIIRIRMLATATHDHKRGEDVRARLAVLERIRRRVGRGRRALDRRQQCLCAAGRRQRGHAVARATLRSCFRRSSARGRWTHRPDDQAALAAFAKRIAAWQQKALREAKLHSDWSAPDEAYERRRAGFIDWLFSGPSGLIAGDRRFRAPIIAPAGAVNGLAQMLLKLTAPGVPDIYQGTEYWDFSLVDPDNRAPVDFAVRQEIADGAIAG